MCPFRRSIALLLAAALLVPSALPAHVPALSRTANPSAIPSLLLIASRKITHPVFRETVILVTRHADGGALGIILNRPLEIALDKIFPTLSGAAKHKLHRGGPVDPGQVSYLFRGGEPAADSLMVADQTYLSSNAILLAELLGGKRAYTGLRVVSGYAGWASGQLENEIARGDWHLLPVDGAALFERPTATLWPDLHRRVTQLSAHLGSSNL